MGGMRTSLAALASSVPGVLTVDDADVEIFDVTHDSTTAGPGVIFVAIPGKRVDGHTFVGSAASLGTPAVMVEHRCDVDIPQIVVADSRAAMAHLARTVHGSPDAAMTVVGVTGTNGKTTVTAMCEAVLTYTGRRVGVIGTLGTRINGEPAPLERTTPESTDLQRLLATMRRAGVETVVMEVSSHAMALHRADAIRFEVAAFTNLSQDHLDFHGDMDTYYSEKRKLFDAGRAEHAVVNIADPAGRRLVDDIEIPRTTVSVGEGADIVGRIVEQDASSSVFSVAEAGVDSVDVTLPVPGWFNVANAMVAYGACRRLGVEPSEIAAGLGTLEVVAGRMQLVEPDADVAVVVDYAHTPAAVGTVVEAARQMTDGRVIVIIGAGGDRDWEKRPHMGAAASSHADVTIVTTDNPRSEDPRTIAAAVEAGASSVPGAHVRTILDRREAIRVGVLGALPGDLVLILGKGHERGQEIDGEKLPFDDVAEARASLAAREHAT